MIPSCFPRYSATEFKAAADAGVLPEHSSEGYYAGWIQPTGEIVSVREHVQACPGRTYENLFNAGIIRLTVEPGWGNHVGFTMGRGTEHLTEEQVRTLIALVVEFWSDGGFATLHANENRPCSSERLANRSEFISFVRRLQRAKVDA